MMREPLAALFQPMARRRLSRSVDQSVQESLTNAPPSPEGASPLSGIIPLRLIPDEKRFAGIAMGGAPAWATRLKRIETLTASLVENLQSDWHSLAWEHRRDPHTFAAVWRARLEHLETGVINELIRRHNLYFPAEANLPMSPHTCDYIGWGGREWRCAPLTSAWAERLFSADHAQALESASRKGFEGKSKSKGKPPKAHRAASQGTQSQPPRDRPHR
jgi:hypothetical protein